MASSMNTFKNVTYDKNRRVKVLYNYEYVDDGNCKVWMKEDEIFYLLNDDLEDWWKVCRPDSPGNVFFVPSTYVQVLTNASVNAVNESPPLKTGYEKEKSDTDAKCINNAESLSMTATNAHGEMNTSMDEPDYENLIGATDTNHISVEVQVVTKPENLFGIETTDCDYVNLEDFRKSANLPPLEKDDSVACPQTPEAESDYANLEQFDLTNIHGQDTGPPNMDNCKHVKTLNDGWEMYKDIPSGRMFYQNKDTQQLQWKPPRGEFHKQLAEKKINRSDGQSPTKSPSSDSDSKSDTFENIESNLNCANYRTGERQQVSERYAKSRSVMFDNLRFQPQSQYQGPPPPKSATLPSNFIAPQEEAPRVFTFDKEPIEGTLKCKFLNGKKISKKWTVSFVKLCGSNLLFYKDQKSSLAKTNALHGKFDLMLSLVTCSVERNKQDQGSKKNQMVIISQEGQIMLKAEDEAKMTEWFLKLHTKIKELGGQPDPPSSVSLYTSASSPLFSPQEPERKLSVKGKHIRKPSDGGSLYSKGKIKDVLNKFITNRSDKEKLRQRGIYKEAVFGADLKQLCAKEKSKVPIFVQRAIEAIEKRGVGLEGIYRIGGNISQIQKLRCLVDQGANYNLDDPIWDINVLTGTLKLFFRELKDPLFTSNLFGSFLKNFLLDKYEDRLRTIKATVGLLPQNNLDTVKLLFKHLTKVIEKHLENKMASHQLAIVFGPTLIWPEVESQNLATSMVYQSRIVEFILVEYKNIFDEKM